MNFEILSIHNRERDEELLPIIQEVKSFYRNGDFVIKQFELSKIPLLKSSPSRIEFFSSLIYSDAFREEFSSIEGFENIDDIDVSQLNTADSDWLLPIDRFKENLAEVFSWAGAYTHSVGIKRCKILSETIIAHICPNPTESHYANIGHKWTSWFYDVAWDYAFIVFDTKESTITIICATDTD